MDYNKMSIADPETEYQVNDTEFVIEDGKISVSDEEVELMGSFYKTEKVEVPVRMYNDLITTKERKEAFERYVKSEEFSIKRETCAAILGFALDDEDEEDA